MTDQTPPLLSDLAERLAAEPGRSAAGPSADGSDATVLVLGGEAPAGASSVGPTDRRTFLARASALSLAIPGIGAALAACTPAGSGGGDSAKGGVAAGSAQGAASEDTRRLGNSNSKLDSAVLKDAPHQSSSAPLAGAPDPATVPYRRYDPALPPLAAGNRLTLHWHANETPIRINADTVIAAWTFEGNVPGPIVHCRVGDTVEFTLTNDVAIPHSMDFHSAQLDPKVAFRSVPRGESVSFTFRPKWAGAFMYHCGTAPVLMHIGSGMYGAMIVSPRDPLPAAKEFVIVQSEYYLADAVNGVRACDYQRMLSTLPDFVTFNGRPNQYVSEPIRVKVGDRVRFWLVDAGPTHPSHFHVVGEQFDTVYLGAPPGSPVRGVQTTTVPAGGGMCFELVCDIPGEFPFVNHGFGHGQKGAIGFLVVEP